MRLRAIRSRSQHQERGTALIEMAMMLPLLTLLLIGVVNMGLVIREHQVLQNAAREGARYSALPANQIDLLTEACDPTVTTAKRTAIQTRVQRYLAQERITINLSDVAVNQCFSYSVGGLTVTGSQVTVTYSPSFLVRTSFLWPFGPVSLTGQAVFRNLGY